ncbi:unnamed protein product [Moneuplotes crassus]|uniref:C2H2-type domain-containing protein n=1 Tax=Euplotes crassus TaxID=5936 RepID=A0AAD2D270_EUPCR|nr:unnamed protein product [Moneuplotes crassus]
MESNKSIFICDFKKCEKIFTTKYSLIRHTQTHLKKKNFKCKQCSKTFNIKQNLIEHEFVHTGEQPYFCNIDGCTQRFRQRGKLSLHRQSHKNYKKKTYRSHTCINDGNLSRRSQVPQTIITQVPPTALQSLPPQTPMPNLSAQNANLYMLNNQFNKLRQLNCGQPLLSLSQNLPATTYSFTASVNPAAGAAGFYGNRITQRLPQANLTQGMNRVMLQHQNFRTNFH